MPSIGDGNFPPQRDFRAAVAPLHRHGSKGAQHVCRGYRLGCQLHPGRLLGKVLPKLGENLIFQRRQPVLGSQHLIFQFFQLLRDVPLTVCQGLLADVGVRHLIHKGLGDLNIVAEHPVKAHF